MGYDFDQLKYSLIQRYSIAEYQPTTNGTGHVVRYKFAFRWCDDQVGLLVLEFPEHAHTCVFVKGSPWWLTDKETSERTYLPLIRRN